MIRLLALGALLLLVGCSMALAQSAVAVPPLSAGIPWGQVIGALGVLATAIGALVKVAHDLLAKLYTAIGAIDARAAAFEKVVADGFNNGITRLDRIEAEQRRSSDAAIHTSDRLDAIDKHVDRIREKMGDDPTAEVPRPAAR